MKFAQLLDKYRGGVLESSDLEGVDAGDLLKVREEAGDGRVFYSLDNLAEAFAKDEKSDGDGVPYVMVSDSLIPPFMDRVEARAWNLDEFKYRGSVLLYDHNIEESRPPIGAMADVKKGQDVTRGKRSFKAVTGTASFVDGGLYPFAGMIGDLVKAGHLRAGSVGFTINESRAASEKEQEEGGMRAYSAVIQKATLEEFSITPLGRDQNAQRFGAEALEPIEAQLAKFAEAGVYDDVVIGSFREDLLERVGKATRFSIAMPGDVTPDAPEPEPAPDTDPAQELRDEMAAQFARLTAQIDDITDELRELRDATSVYALIDDLIDHGEGDSPEPATEQTGAPDGDVLDRIYSLAVEQGFDPTKQ